MAIGLERTVEFAMVDLANIAYYPRIFDLAHRFFEACWPDICDQTYATLIHDRRIGFPVVSLDSTFVHPLKFGDTIQATISLTRLGTTSVAWRYVFSNQHGEVVWTSNQTTVCVNMDSMKPQPIPDDIRSGFALHLEEVNP